MASHVAAPSPDRSAVTARPPAVTLVLGGARSGKSRYAESLIEAHRGRWLYLATAEAGDAEMAARIAQHQARRGDGWETIEEPVELPAVLAQQVDGTTAVLVDCLTLWLSNLLGTGADVEQRTEELVISLKSCAGTVVLVSNEVGLGIVPMNALSRSFVDHAGRLHQRIAEAADRVVFIAAGLPLQLKPQSERTD